MDKIKHSFPFPEVTIYLSHFDDYSFFSPCSLLQEDLWHRNLLVGKVNQTPFVIDWTSYTIEPYFIDTVRFFTGIDVLVEEAYLNDKRIGRTFLSLRRFFYIP